MPQGGGYSSNTNTFVNTSFNDSAQKSIYSGTTPFIGDHRPDQSLSQLQGEDKFGIWKVVLAHSDWTVESGHTIDVSHVSIDIDSETYSGSIYDETNNWVTTTTNTSPGGVGPSGSYNVLINSSPGSSGGVIDDIDVEVSLRGDHPDHLRYLTITLSDAGFNPPRESVVLFSGDQVTSGGYNKNFNTMTKLRFDDESDNAANSGTPVHTRMKPVESMNNAFEGKSRVFYVTITNSNDSNGIDFDTQAIKTLIRYRGFTGGVPTANDMNLSVNEDTALNITFDATGDNALEYYVQNTVSNGILGSINQSTGQIIYMPNPNFNGTDSFSYKVKDTQNNSYSDTATVFITVNAIDDNPIATNVSSTTDEDSSVTFNLSAEEYDGDTYEFVIISEPSNGTASIASAQATYIPNANFNGVDSFTFQAQDTQGRMNIATATITVNSINDRPEVEDISVTIDEDKSVDITLQATDVDNDNLSYSIVNDASNGTTTLNDNTLTYKPNANWNGTDTLTYKVSDGVLDSNIATVTITVNDGEDSEIFIHTGVTNGDGSIDNHLIIFKMR